jgi:hypothetical protein
LKYNTYLDKPKEIPTFDCLMSGLAIFTLKYKSLPKFEEDKVSERNVRRNLTTIYGVSKSPFDAYHEAFNTLKNQG